MLTTNQNLIYKKIHAFSSLIPNVMDVRDINFTIDTPSIRVMSGKIENYFDDLSFAFTLPEDDHKNIFFAICDSYYIKSVENLIAYCQWYTYGKEIGIGNYLSKNSDEFLKNQSLPSVLFEHPCISMLFNDNVELESHSKGQILVEGDLYSFKLVIPLNLSELNYYLNNDLDGLHSHFELSHKDFCNFEI